MHKSMNSPVLWGTPNNMSCSPCILEALDYVKCKPGYHRRLFQNRGFSKSYLRMDATSTRCLHLVSYDILHQCGHFLRTLFLNKFTNAVIITLQV